VLDELQAELAAEDAAGASECGDGRGTVFGVKQSVELASAGVHTAGHFDFQDVLFFMSCWIRQARTRLIATAWASS
jgi:hypothetical protein